MSYAAAEENRNEGMAVALGSASFGAYVLGGPIVHAAHGNWGRAGGSLLLRVGAPVVGGLVGVAVENCSGGDFCGIAGGGIGGILGILTAVTIDSAVLAHETVKDEPVVMPVMSTGKNGTWVGVSGRF